MFLIMQNIWSIRRVYLVFQTNSIRKRNNEKKNIDHHILCFMLQID